MTGSTRITSTRDGIRYAAWREPAARYATAIATRGTTVIADLRVRLLPGEASTQAVKRALHLAIAAVEFDA